MDGVEDTSSNVYEQVVPDSNSHCNSRPFAELCNEGGLPAPEIARSSYVAPTTDPWPKSYSATEMGSERGNITIVNITSLHCAHVHVRRDLHACARARTSYSLLSTSSFNSRREFFSARSRTTSSEPSISTHATPGSPRWSCSVANCDSSIRAPMKWPFRLAMRWASSSGEPWQ